MLHPIQITYLTHSAFAVSVRDTLLVFDDAQVRSEQDAAGCVTREMIEAHQRTLFFVSHAHADHFNPAIYDFADVGMVYYVLGSDVPEHFAGHHMRKGETLSLGGADITAYGSTDEGVSYLVRLEGWSLFHAGDLNLWHWREVSSLKEIEQAERDYEAEVTPLFGQEIDFAFFPLDPRMGAMYDAGALHFAMNVKPRVLIPMHFWGRSDAALEFARRNRSRQVEIIAMTRPGETLKAQKSESGEITVEL